MTWSDKTGLIAHHRKSNFFTQIQIYVITLLGFIVRLSPVITGLFLQAAFSWPSGDLYEQSGVFMVS